MAFWAYMLHCRGGYFYVGHTDHLERRIAQHETGELTGFASDHRPFTLVWSETFPTRLQALEAERRLKGWGRAKKMALIRGDWDDVSRLAKGKDSASTRSARTAQGESES
jgi:predicted GIY-YIG superfamily endonuclease